MEASMSHLISWSEPTRGDVPPPLTGPSITVSPLPHPHPPTVFLFGGKYVQTRRLTAEMWAMDLGTKSWEKIDAGVGPGPRYFHSMDTWEDKLVCFGGMSDSDPMTVHSDIWVFDCASRRWLPPPSPAPGIAQDPADLPSPRYAHLSAVSRGKLIISGGQHADNSWVYEINVYDLRRRVWVSKTEQPEVQGLHSKGAYRSVACSSKQRVILPPRVPGVKGSHAQSYSIEEDGEGGDIWCYSNYDFAKVRRELDVLSPSETLEPPASHKQVSPPNFAIHDESARMRGSSQPPGLRFPTGGVIGNNFILCGLYLASSSAAFSIWSLDLTTLAWRHLDPSVLATGSWNRAVLWPERARLLVFGNSRFDLAADYGKRAVNLDHVAVISLETYGIYRPPKLEVPAKAQEVGLTMLDENLTSDFDVVCDDGRRVRCSRQILRERWPWFAQKERDLADRVNGIVRDAPALDINDTLGGGLSSARLMPTHLNIPEPFSVCVALVQYFYTLSLSTELQNRAPVLSALLFAAKQYRIERLRRLVVHALHQRLEPNVAVGVYEIASLAGEQNLQVRALSMIHGKNGLASRTGRPGAAGSAVPNDGAPTQSSVTGSVPDTGNSQDTASSSFSRGGAVIDDGNFRRARAESMTLQNEQVVEIRQHLQSLSVESSTASSRSHSSASNHGAMLAPDVTPRPETTPRPESPLERPTYPTRMRVGSDRLPPSMPPPLGLSLPPTSGLPVPPPRPAPPPSLGLLPSFDAEQFKRYPSYPLPAVSNSPGTASPGTDSPPTPPDAPRDQAPLNLSHYPSTISMNSRSSSASGPSRSALPTLPEAESAYLASPAKINTLTLEVAGLTGRQPPPTSWSSHQAQMLNNLSSLASLEAPSTPSSRVPSLSSGASSSASPAGRDGRHLSILTTSTDYSDVRSTPMTPLSGEFALPYGTLQRSNTSVTARDSMSISSGSTGTSSKRQEKLEKKMQVAADKAAKKEESRTKFEMLRAEQQRKTALQKAEAQKKAEIAQKTAPPPKAAPKSKFGKLGAKFSESVLFPSGGEKSTMF